MESDYIYMAYIVPFFSNDFTNYRLYEITFSLS